jgi:hypothetical protein
VQRYRIIDVSPDLVLPQETSKLIPSFGDADDKLVVNVANIPSLKRQNDFLSESGICKKSSIGRSVFPACVQSMNRDAEVSQQNSTLKNRQAWNLTQPIRDSTFLSIHVPEEHGSFRRERRRLLL